MQFLKQVHPIPISGFLEKLSSTIVQRVNVDDTGEDVQDLTKTTLSWKSTKEVSKRVKTATGEFKWRILN